MAISTGLWVLMSKVLVMISVIAAVMAFLTIVGLSIPRRLEQWDMAGGRRARCRCDGRPPQPWPTASSSRADCSALPRLIRVRFASSCLRGCCAKLPPAEVRE